MPKTPTALPARTAGHPRPALAARTPLRAVALLGPALVAGVAYLDPGNVAANMTAGAQFGYLLVWVVVLGNLIAWLVQYLSAKLGVVTGQSLPELLRERIRRPALRRLYWLQAELVVMATDIAEVIGGAIALNLLFGVPLVWGGAITGAISIVLLAVQSRGGARRFEAAIVALLIVIVIGFGAGVLFAPPDPGGVLAGLVPRFEGTGSVLLATSILGATIMPHAIYAHSALARDRFAPTTTSAGAGAGASAGVDVGVGVGAATVAAGAVPDIDDAPRIRRLLRATRWDVTIALVVAGAINVIMLLVAAAALSGAPGTDSIEGAYRALRDGIGPAVATLFAVGLLASGLASTAVGAYAGGEVMAGLLRRRIPMVLRRLVTLAPALVILALGTDPTGALVLSQVVLSFGIPFAVVPLVSLTAGRTLGAYRNRIATTIAGIAASIVLIALNAVLLALVISGG